MASIFKRNRNDKPSKKWFIGYRDYDGRWREVVGTTDKTTTIRIAARLEAEVELRRRGLIDPAEEKRAEEAKKSISTHLEAFEEHLESKNNTDKHIDSTINLIASVIDACVFKSIADVDAAKVAMHINDLKRQNCGLVAINNKLTAIKAFGKWLWRTDRVATDPLKMLSKINTKIEKRHHRRALSEDEIARLIHAAENGSDFIWRAERRRDSQHFKLTGLQRSMLYKFCIATGLRASEAGSLTSESFNLTDLDDATLSVDAAYSKHRREDVLPIRRDLAEQIQDFIAGKKKHELIFIMPPKPADMLKVDLKAAGIVYRDESDKVADFHSLRHTFITRLVRSGVTPAVAKTLARHSTITLTLDYYTHVLVGDERAALEKMPGMGGGWGNPAKMAGLWGRVGISGGSYAGTSSPRDWAIVEPKSAGDSAT